MIDSVAAANVLAALPVRLTLLGLRRVTPETFAALVAKEDVLMPRLETIEFMASPDGAVTDDFEIPNGFESRQDKLCGASRRP